MKLRVGLVQMRSDRDIDRNLETSTRLGKEAVRDGARWVLFPENAPFLGADREKVAIAEPLDGPIASMYTTFARENDVWVSVAGLPEYCDANPEKTYNTQILVNPKGEITAVYRKIHLFDAQVDAETTYRESASVEAGNEVVNATVKANDLTLNVGLTICYDLRFPELFRELRARGADAITVPSAFTLQTGRDHWHPLLRARAIEDQVYILAPNQQGVHFGNRASYGHSCVYDPWGHLQACAPDRECVVTAALDLGYLATVRQRMPVMSHRRLQDM